ncbi:hypothetical protein INT48_003927 [Thamnidium elegans]|uniref:Uncharacterized protein n=1 Tax=Thamnidium elegans TaxID=101142 RepID=A0A8H7SWL8_9FUNG|nr:hypothetical protein INT48_003927 [Thamnidium elegans]
MAVFRNLAPPTSCPPDACKIKDTLNNTVVTITEWISSELYRIQNDVRPRHCENYEQLTEIIVDTRLLEPLQVAAPPLPIHDDQEIILFVEIMRYCSRAGTSTNAPRLFLNEFEKLCQEVKLGNTVNAITFRENLLKILFGKIQMAEQLVQCWKFACEWVTGAPLNNQKNALHWIEINLNAYIAAQRAVINEHIMRKCLQDQIRRNSELKLSSDIAICKK